MDVVSSVGLSKLSWSSISNGGKATRSQCFVVWVLRQLCGTVFVVWVWGKKGLTVPLERMTLFFSKTQKPMELAGEMLDRRDRLRYADAIGLASEKVVRLLEEKAVRLEEKIKQCHEAIYFIAERGLETGMPKRLGPGSQQVPIMVPQKRSDHGSDHGFTALRRTRAMFRRRSSSSTSGKIWKGANGRPETEQRAQGGPETEGGWGRAQRRKNLGRRPSAAVSGSICGAARDKRL